MWLHYITHVTNTIDVIFTCDEKDPLLSLPRVRNLVIITTPSLLYLVSESNSICVYQYDNIKIYFIL